MPMIQCDLTKDLFEAKGTEISQAIHEGLMAGLDMPGDDLFQVFRTHRPEEIVFSPTYGGVERRDLILIRVTMQQMFSNAEKQRMHREIVQRLEAAGIRHQDVLICILETGFEAWYAGGDL